MFLLDPGFLEPTISIAVSETTTRYDDGLHNEVDESFVGGQRLSLAAGLKVRPELAIVLHGAVALTSTTQALVAYDYQTGDPQRVAFPYTYRPYEVGVGATYTVLDRLSVSPWIGLVGVHTKATGGSEPKQFGFGAELGVDLYVVHRERVSVMLDASYSKLNDYSYQPNPDDLPTVDPKGHDAALVQFGIGLAYRHF